MTSRESCSRGPSKSEENIAAGERAAALFFEKAWRNLDRVRIIERSDQRNHDHRSPMTPKTLVDKIWDAHPGD
jgi:hypothetical protein